MLVCNRTIDNQPGYHLGTHQKCKRCKEENKRMSEPEDDTHIDMQSPWEEITAIHPVHLAPKWLGDLEAGVDAYLKSYLYSYDPIMEAIPMAYSRIDWSLLSDSGGKASVINDNPQVHFEVRVRWTVFVPKPGYVTEGMTCALDGTGMTVKIMDNLLIVVPSSDLIMDWEEDNGFWYKRRDSVIPVPQVGQQVSVVISGTGGPTGVLGRLKR